MALPAPRVDVKVGGTWVDATCDTLARDRATITRGRANEAARADPGRCVLSLKNESGKYSWRNPTSPYFGLLGRNTPLRVGVGTPPAVALTAAQTGTSIVAPSVTAETAGALFCTWVASPVGNFTIPGGFAVGTERDGTSSTWGAASKLITAGATGTTTATFSTAATAAAAVSVFVPGPLSSVGYSLIDTTGAGIAMGVAVAAGDYILMVYGWSADVDDRMQRMPADVEGTTSWMLLADSGASSGPRMRACIRRATTASASLAMYVDGPGTGLGDTYARAWVITGATEYLPRFTGEVARWPVQWDPTGRSVWTSLEAAGVSRRLGRGSSLRSALTRQIMRSTGVLAYWPMEDGTGSTSFSSAMPWNTPMAFLGTPTLAADAGFAGSEALPTFTGAGATGYVPAPFAGSVGYVAFGALISMPSGGTASEAVLLAGASTAPPQVVVAPSITSWTVKYVTGGSLRIEAFDRNGTSKLNQVIAFGVDATRFYLRVTAQTVVNTVQWSVWTATIRPNDTIPDALLSTGTIALSTVADLSSISVGSRLDLTGDVTIGHVMAASADVFGSPTSSGKYSALRSLAGWIGETAADRFKRLCTEERILYDVQAAHVSSAMGAQSVGTFLGLLGECEAADGGSVYEPRGFLGLAYRTRTSKYNQTPRVSLSYTAQQVSAPFEPVDDDQALTNDVTVTRKGGSSARWVLSSGPLSVQAPPYGVGVYDSSVDLNLAQDSQLADQAAWRGWIGTRDEPRYPSVTINLVNLPSMLGPITATDVGDAVAVTDLPTFVGPNAADLLVEGYTETIGYPNDWQLTANCSPGGTYRVAVLDSSTYGRADSLTSTLAVGANSTIGTFSVAVAAGSALWITTATFPSQFPFAAVVGGEEVSVTGISGTTSPQTWTVTRSVNGVVKAQTAQTQIRLARPTAVAL